MADDEVAISGEAPRSLNRKAVVLDFLDKAPKAGVGDQKVERKGEVEALRKEVENLRRQLESKVTIGTDERILL